MNFHFKIYKWNWKKKTNITLKLKTHTHNSPLTSSRNRKQPQIPNCRMPNASPELKLRCHRTEYDVDRKNGCKIMSFQDMSSREKRKRFHDHNEQCKGLLIYDVINNTSRSIEKNWTWLWLAFSTVTGSGFLLLSVLGFVNKMVSIHKGDLFG